MRRRQGRGRDRGEGMGRQRERGREARKEVTEEGGRKHCGSTCSKRCNSSSNINQTEGRVHLKARNFGQSAACHPRPSAINKANKYGRNTEEGGARVIKVGGAINIFITVASAKGEGYVTAVVY